MLKMLVAVHTLAVHVMLSCDIMTALGGPVVPTPHTHTHTHTHTQSEERRE